MTARIRDQWNIVRKLNFRKSLNLLRLFVSYFLTRVTGRVNIQGLPVSLSIEPTTACNLGCPECPSGLKSFSRETGNLRTENFREWIDQSANHLLYLNLYFQGEPFIHASLFDLVSYAHKKGIYTSTSTNAHFLNEANARRTIASGLDRIIISIDGTTQETYEQYRKFGQLDKVLEGTKNLIRCKDDMKSATPYIIFQFLVVKPNEHQVEEVKKLARNLRVDELRFKTAQVYQPSDHHPLIPTEEKYSRYIRRKDGSYSIKNALENACKRMWMGAVITWDGKMVPCCFDKDAQHQLGDLKFQSLRNIWYSERYQSFRRAVFTDRKSIDICANCSEGTKVWA